MYVWMLDQARWWSGWLVLAELISQFPGWEELNANRLSCCFPDQAGCFLMRQADRELSHWRGRLTHENETPRSAYWDREGRLGRTGRVKEWKGGRMGRRRVAYQLSEDWVTGQGRWLGSETPPRAFEWQETKGTSLHTQQWLQLPRLPCRCHLTGLQGPILFYSGTIHQPRVSAEHRLLIYI